MARIYLTFTLSKHVGFPPANCIAAVDIDGDEQPDAGEWLRMKRSKLKWTGSKETGRGSGDDLLVMVAYVGTIGAKFKLVARMGKADGDVVGEVAGTVVQSPASIWLWCSES